jgi:hypothetical protein
MRVAAKVIAAAFLIGTLAWGAWRIAGQTTPICNILRNPDDFAGKTVTIKGTVISRLVLGGHRSYVLLDDDGGEIRVITDRLPPPVGKQRRVHGEVDMKLAIRPPILGELKWVVFKEN